MLQHFVSNILSYIRREDEDGQTLVEYALLLALIAIVVIAALLILGPIVSGIFSDVGDTLGGTN
jgi:pilus assembly protein Flp/PilA